LRDEKKKEKKRKKKKNTNITFFSLKKENSPVEFISI